MSAAPPDPASAAGLPELHRRFGTQFVLITRAWRQAADRRLAPLGLSHATATALLLLHDQPESRERQGSLAAALGIEQPSLVRLLDQLGAAGLVERRPDPADRRAKTLHLTAAGHRAAAAAGQRLTALRAELLGGADPAELGAAMRVLEGMRGVLDRLAAAPRTDLPDPPSAEG